MIGVVRPVFLIPPPPDLHMCPLTLPSSFGLCTTAVQLCTARARARIHTFLIGAFALDTLLVTLCLLSSMMLHTCEWFLSCAPRSCMAGALDSSRWSSRGWWRVLRFFSALAPSCLHCLYSDTRCCSCCCCCCCNTDSSLYIYIIYGRPETTTEQAAALLFITCGGRTLFMVGVLDDWFSLCCMACTLRVYATTTVKLAAGHVGGILHLVPGTFMTAGEVLTIIQSIILWEHYDHNINMV